MNYITNEFNTKGYAYIENFLDSESVNKLTSALFELVETQKTTKDDQCPFSEAVHGAPVFDSLLEQLVPNIEIASGRRVHPTYAYARLYAPGEELKIHKDREACEISVTLTLGFKGPQWPIFMGNTEDKSDGEAISMRPGDAVIYKGCEKYHWREKYNGEYQAQVFLHYVDSDGPNANQKYDGRNQLAHHGLNDEKDEDTLLYTVFENAISSGIRDQIMQITEKNAMSRGLLANTEGILDLSIRDVNKVDLSLNRGIGAILTGIGINANKEKWQFDIEGSNQCDYLLYDNNGHYTAHIDTIMYEKTLDCRKLTTIAFLNDDFEGGKLFLFVGGEKIYPPQSAGNVLVFPSFLLHGVEPVTEGIRRSVVTWMFGPFFK